MARARWSRRKYTLVRMPLESQLRKHRFSLPAEPSELDVNLTVDNARGAIHGRIPRTRGYIRPSSVPLIENVRAKQDLTDPNAHVPFSSPLLPDPVLQQTIANIRNRTQLPEGMSQLPNRLTELLAPRPPKGTPPPIRPDQFSDPMGMIYSKRADIEEIRRPQRKRMKELYPSGEGTIPPGMGVKDYFQMKVAERKLKRMMERLRSDPTLWDEAQRGDRTRLDKTWRGEED